MYFDLYLAIDSRNTAYLKYVPAYMHKRSCALELLSCHCCSMVRAYKHPKIGHSTMASVFMLILCGLLQVHCMFFEIDSYCM